MATSSSNRKNTLSVYECAYRSYVGTRKAFSTEKCNPYTFLNEPIKEIASFDVVSSYLFDGVISLESNLQYIEASARKWCELHGKPYDVEYSVNPNKMIVNIFDMLCRHTDEDRFDLDFDPRDKMLKIIEYRYCAFPSYSVFYLPAKRIDDYEGEDMRELLLRFYSFIYHETLFCLPEDTFDFSMLFDVPYEDAENEMGFEMSEMVKSYREGEARSIFERISNLPATQRTPQAIRSFIENLSESDRRYNIRLIECIEKGLTLMMEDDLRKHSYFDGYCSDDRFDARWEGDKIFPERLFVICYDFPDKDELASTACQALSEEANCMDTMDFRDGRYLSPDDTEIFEPSTYPSEWAEWFGELIDFL